MQQAGLAWPDFLRFVSWLDQTMSAEKQPVALKLRRALHWLGAVEKAGFDQISGREADEILGVLSQHLIVLLDPAAVVDTMHDAYGRLDLTASPYGVFLAGPSATGDIEGVIIHGRSGVASSTMAR